MRYHAYRLPNLELITGAVQLRGATLYRGLNEPGELKATLDKAAAFQNLTIEGTDKTVPLLSDQGTLLVADPESDDQPARAFIVGPLEEDSDGQDRVIFSAVGFGHTPKDQPWDPANDHVRQALADVPGWRPKTGEVAGVEVDPLDMVRAIWTLLNASPDTINVEVDATRSPVRIGEEERTVEFTTGDGADVSFETGPYRLNWWDTDDLQKEIDDRATETPFEWREETLFNRDDDSPPSFRIRLGYPRFESVRRDNLHFELDTNVFDAKLADEDEYFSEVLVVGNGEGSQKRRGHHARRHHGRLRKVKVISGQGVDSHRLANEIARKACEQADRDARFIASCTVKDHPAARLGTFDIGDIITIKGQTVWGPHEQDCRIITLEHNVDAHQVEITLERLPE